MDSGALYDLTPEEQETSRRSNDPSLIMTANRKIHTTEDATEYVHEFDMFVEVQLLKESPAVLPQCKILRRNGHSYG